MPFGSLKPVCFRCSSVESLIWRKVLADEQSNKEEIICNSCSIELKKTRVYLNADDRGGLSKGEDGQEKETNSETGSTSSKVNNKDKDEQSSKQTKMLTRKSTRSKRGSNRLNLKSNQSNKGKSRRNIFKRNVYKSPSSICYPMSRDSVFHNGINYSVGDIVSMVDADEGTTYFAQIKGFLQDQFCEKSAAITWLIPNTRKAFKPISQFSPSDYVLGPEEDYPRKLDCMEFVCRSPSDYYKAGESPYLTARPSVKQEYGYIWTTIGPVLFGSDENEDDYSDI